MAYDDILFSAEDGVARLTLNRPEKLNAFTRAMHGEIRDALETVAGDPAIRCLLLTGAGRGFCAGQDLSDRVRPEGGPPPDLGETIDGLYNPLIRTLRGLEKPVVVAVNGVAAGSGANVALAGDIVVAARSASFIQSFARLGLIPDAGGSWVLPRLVGHARATALAMLAERVTAEEAERMGMIWRCVDDDALAAETEALAHRLAAMPTRGLGLIKQAMNASLGNSLDAQLDLERDLQRTAGRTDDYREGVAAFMEKRPPVFKGT